MARVLTLPELELEVPPLELPGGSGRPGASPRVRAARLRVRMRAQAEVYNAAWFVRHTWFSAGQARVPHVAAMWQAVDQARGRGDPEAVLYVIADALTSAPHGVPWES